MTERFADRARDTASNALQTPPGSISQNNEHVDVRDPARQHLEMPAPPPKRQVQSERLSNVVARRSPRLASKVAEAVGKALAAQDVTVPAEAVAGRVIARRPHPLRQWQPLDPPDRINKPGNAVPARGHTGTCPVMLIAGVGLLCSAGGSALSRRQDEPDQASCKRGSQSYIDSGHQVVVPFGFAAHADRLRADGQAAEPHPPRDAGHPPRSSSQPLRALRRAEG